MTAAERIAEWALGLRLEEIPLEVQHAAQRHLLDGIGCAVAAVRTGAAQYALDAAARVTAPREATVLGTTMRLPSPAAALANGTLVHALDYDDTHGEALVHATAAVLPAAFAVGEETGARGAEVLAACVAGYEIVIRLGAVLPHAFHARGLHATSVCGVFAAAAVAARLGGLGIGETVSALGIAGSTAAGSLEFLHTGSATKQLHPGLASSNGITAARLAMGGAEGPASILEGEYGLYRSLAGARIEAGQLTAGLGSRWETARITVKPYAACQLSHAPLDALRAAGPLDHSEIEEIAFTLPPGSIPIVCEPVEIKRGPRTPYEGKFSLPYCAAAMLIDGELRTDSFEPEMLGRPDVLSLADRVTWTAHDRGVAPADAPGIVEVRLRDGSVRRGEVAASRGGPDSPLSDDELLAKFEGNCGGRSPGSDAVVEAVAGMRELPDLAPLMSAAATLAVLEEVL